MSCLKLFNYGQCAVVEMLRISKQENAGYKMRRHMRIIYDSTHRNKKNSCVMLQVFAHFLTNLS